MDCSQKDWAAIVVPVGPGDNVVLVIDETKPAPHYWKFPGGRKEPYEGPEETAVRELMEETGLRARKLVLLKKIDKETHIVYVFLALLSSFEGQKRRGVEGERVAQFPGEELDLDLMVDFLPPHRPYWMWAREVLKKTCNA